MYVTNVQLITLMLTEVCAARTSKNRTISTNRLNMFIVVIERASLGTSIRYVELHHSPSLLSSSIRCVTEPPVPQLPSPGD